MEDLTLQLRQMETIDPIHKNILIRKEKDKNQTEGGIILPDRVNIPTITARVLAIDSEVEKDGTCRIGIMDKVIVNPHRAIQVDFENNVLYLIPYEDILAVIKREKTDAKNG